MQGVTSARSSPRPGPSSKAERGKVAMFTGYVAVAVVAAAMNVWVASLDLSCIGLVTTLVEVVKDGVGGVGDAWPGGDLLAAEADGR